ncbi:MAG: hypothetical protein VX589_06145 [Myxococcota bacterium]|nr:hypothetical protein [Myxococcota bacterium]
MGTTFIAGCNTEGGDDQNAAQLVPTSSPPSDPTECNPIAQELDCLFPFPSDFFLNNGRFTAQPATLLTTVRGDAVELNDLESDGFPVYPSIVFQVPRPVSDESLRATKSVLVNSATKTEVPHRLEVYEGDDLPATYLAIRPATRLSEATRYVVAIGPVNDAEQRPMSAPAGFTALRDGYTTSTINQALLSRYNDEIFSVLTDAGMVRESLHLAWDFTTRSRSDLTGTMLAIRSQTLTWLEENQPRLKDISVSIGSPGKAAYVIRGRFETPRFIEVDEPGTKLSRDPTGQVMHRGELDVEFVVNVPSSVRTRGETVPFLQFGHGFFGTCGEATSGTQVNFTEDRRYVLGCTNWSGMTIDDGAFVLGKLGSDPANTAQFVPRVYQAMANQLVFTHAARRLTDLPAGQFDDGRAMWNDDIEFFGISQGHILGGVIAALSPEFTRTVLNVGGAGLGLIMTRSTAFAPFNVLLRSEFAALEALKFQVLLPTALERIDPIAYAPFILSEPLPNNPPKQILLQGALGDSQVPNLAIEVHANAIGIPLLTPAPRRPILDGQQAPYPASSGLAYFDVGVDHDWATRWRESAGMNVGHDGLRTTPEARTQMELFLSSGRIQNPCDGPCRLDL